MKSNSKKNKTEELKKLIFQELNNTEKMPDGIETLSIYYGAREIFKELVKTGKAETISSEISNYYKSKGLYVSLGKNKINYQISFSEPKQEKKIIRNNSCEREYSR